MPFWNLGTRHFVSKDHHILECLVLNVLGMTTGGEEISKSSSGSQVRFPLEEEEAWE